MGMRFAPGANHCPAWALSIAQSVPPSVLGWEGWLIALDTNQCPALALTIALSALLPCRD